MASVEDLIPVDALGQAKLVRRGEITPIELSVRDSAALLDATSGPDVGDPYWAPPPERPFLQEVGADPGRLRIAFSTQTPTGADLHAESSAAL